MSLFQEPSEEHVRVLQKYFGHMSFKREQWNIIRAIMYDKRDCCVIASTGFGKSLIYQYPAVYLKKLVVVISPLIALMQDQVFSLKKKGIKACFFGSQQMDKTLRMKDHEIVYITPEFYVYGKGKSDLVEVKNQIALFAVDEAHVLDQWGNDFRPAYKKLFELRQDYPSVPIIALTATAPKYVENMITSSLRFHSNFYFVKTALDRPNLEFIVQEKTSGYVSQVLPYLRQVTEGSAIVYCLSRNLTVEMAEAFTLRGVPCKPYHAGMKADERKELVNDFRNNKVRFVICTIAFGMGIDKSDVRLVLHYGLPKSLEAYYQEAGRAGRDGKPSKCVLFHGSEDEITALSFIEGSNKNVTESQRQLQRELLRRVVAFAHSKQCRRLEILNYLTTTEEELKKITIRENCCDNCKYDLIYTVPAHMAYSDLNEEGYYDFTVDARLLLSLANGHLTREELVDHLLGNVMPNRRTCVWWNLKYFGVGNHKTSAWWSGLISLLAIHNYIYFQFNVRDIVHLKNKSKKFLRRKTKTCLMIPTLTMLSHMKKRENVEFFWQNGTIAHRPKTQPQVVAQDLRRIELDDDDDLDEILAVCDLIENDSIHEDFADSKPIKTETKQEEQIEVSDGEENFFDEATLKTIKTIEETEKLKTKVISNSQLLKDQKEVESILNISKECFDGDENEVSFVSKKRCHEEGEIPHSSKSFKPSKIVYPESILKTMNSKL